MIRSCAGKKNDKKIRGNTGNNLKNISGMIDKNEFWKSADTSDDIK